VGDAGCAALAGALEKGAADTTLHVRVPGKPDESSGLDCVTPVGLPPECPILCNTPACVLHRRPNTPAECAVDVNSFLFMHESAHVQFIFIITSTLLLHLLQIFPQISRPKFHVKAHHKSLKSRPMMPTFLRKPAGIRRHSQQRRGKPRIKLK
jgi:hypothetical protein